MLFPASVICLLAASLHRAEAVPHSGGEQLEACGEASYLASKYTCYDGDFLCPVLNGEPTLRCGPDCYSLSFYSCSDGHLVYPAERNHDLCPNPASQLYISQTPYENYFYSDCYTSVQVVVTSPAPSSNLTLIGPRLLVAWPGGNSGVVVFWSPKNGVNGSLAISLKNGTDPSQGSLAPIYNSSYTQHPQVGVSGFISINSTAVLSVAILGSIRTIRDFTEGPSILVPEIQNATSSSIDDGGNLVLKRVWLDNSTTTTLSFSPVNSGSVSLDGANATFEAGVYSFSAYYDYPQLEQLRPNETLAPHSQGLVAQQPDQTFSLSFFSYTDKLLAGAWRFLTYFGRDSMLTLLLMQPILSNGEGGAIEAVIGSVLERINGTDGSACHEETIGDYATYLNQKDNITSTKPQCDYKMIDTDYYLPILIKNYFVDTDTGMNRSEAFFGTRATADFGNGNLTYADLALLNAEKIMNSSAAFTADGGQVKENLVHLKEGQIVGQWRDSTYGIGGGRIPFDVNTALVPAALRAIGMLAANGYFDAHPEWNTTADAYAQVWEDESLKFFEVAVSEPDAKSLVTEYVQNSGFSGPSSVDTITTEMVYHGLALDGYNNQSLVKVMNTDDCFRHFLLNTTNQTQLSNFISETADHILQPFPVGLSTSLGLLIANPAYGGDTVYTANWTANAYQGTVVWSWQMAMMAAGLERQLYRCTSVAVPDFCTDPVLHAKVVAAYNHLWDLIDANRQYLSQEMWTWVYEGGDYEYRTLGDLPPAPGAGYTESDVRQLWSLTFLAVTRNERFRSDESSG